MAEVLFVLTTIFVAYVVYAVVNDQRATAKSTVPQVKSEKQEVAAVQPQAAAAPQKEAPAARRAAARRAAPAKPAAPAPEAGKGEVRNPATGEVVSAHSNYRFTKRWVKEALVAEGLLDKIYKNNELDAAAEAKIKGAMAKLASMDKYQA
jgi:biotin carboxyl carrier protein